MTLKGFITARKSWVYLLEQLDTFNHCCFSMLLYLSIRNLVSYIKKLSKTPTDRGPEKTFHLIYSCAISGG
jgi:hypothetical protein